MKKIIIIAVAVLVILIGGGVAAFILLNQPPKPIEIVYSEYKFDEEYSNLADVAKNRIIKYQVTVEYTNAELLPKIESNKTKLRNNVDEIMRSTYATDIESRNGKERLRNKIRNMFIDVLESDEDTITNIYIQPFVVQ